MRRLFAQMLGKYLMGVVFTALIIFGCAGSIHFLRGWLTMAALFVPMMGMGLYLFIRSPETLAKRLNAGESERVQRGVIALSGLIIPLSIALAGLDARFGWSHMSMAASVCGLGLLVAGYGLFTAVVVQNAYAARTVSIQHGQKLVDTGLYGIVRHPMYTSTLVIFLAIPVALGSLVALAAMLPFPLLIVARIRNEEAMLCEGLDGYREYTRRVRYRLIPLIW